MTNIIFTEEEVAKMYDYMMKTDEIYRRAVVRSRLKEYNDSLMMSELDEQEKISEAYNKRD